MRVGHNSWPYVPNTDVHRQEMLEAIGVQSSDSLFSDIPEQYRKTTLDLPEPLSELELRRELQAISELNLSANNSPSFLGGGCYHHFVPAVVNHVSSMGGMLTAYTPYQPEVSQGTLQATYEFQSLVSQLLGMEVANAGMYDGATSFAEAALMACRVTGRKRIGILDSVSPAYVSVVRTYAEPQGLDIYLTTQDDPLVNEDTACLLTQHPNYYGYLENLESLETKIHDNGSLFVVATDPIFVGMFKPPGEYGADIVVAEGQPLGVAMSYGGPYVGLFTCRTRFLRQMPGRIVGKTEDTKGREGYVLTLQTREQHIRRERATSNICTSEALIGTLVVSYLACMGKTGLRHISEMTYHNAHYAASLIADIPGFSLPLNGTFFQEFIVKCPLPPSIIQRVLLDKGIICGIDVSEQIENGILICVTEMNTKKEIDDLVAAMKSMVGGI